MTAIDLFVEIIREHTSKTKWTDARLGEFQNVANTVRGEIGDVFIRRYLADNGITSDKKSRTNPTDLEIHGKLFEIKTASEDVGGNFQFNHIRLDRNYDYLLCLGVSPNNLSFNVWGKGTVAEGRAGRLVRMAEGQSVTFKLTKSLSSMKPINEFLVWVTDKIVSWDNDMSGDDS